MTDGCRGMSSSRSSVERHERLADDESRNWPALGNASGTRLRFLVWPSIWKLR
jgi:hypothetical protein